MVDEGGPVTRTGRPWRAYPLHGTVEATPAGGIEPVARADSDEQGRFRMVLAPGSYVLRARNLTGAPVPVARPVTIHVTAGEFADITIHFDSGIR
jgi:hypothetical protein